MTNLCKRTLVTRQQVPVWSVVSVSLIDQAFACILEMLSIGASSGHVSVSFLPTNTSECFMGLNVRIYILNPWEGSGKLCRPR